MHKEIILESFKKAKSETGTDVLTSLSIHISEVLFEEQKFQINERTLRNYYKKALKSDDDDFVISKNIVAELTKYIGYTDIREYSETHKTKNKKRIFEKVGIGMLIVTATYFGIDSTQKKCMIWKGNSYEKISCEEENAKPIKKGVLLNFKKIEPDCSTEYFTKKGEVKIWYGKNPLKEYEYFTRLGLHPETEKTLKPITKYMINEHICSTYGKR